MPLQAYYAVSMQVYCAVPIQAYYALHEINHKNTIAYKVLLGLEIRLKMALWGPVLRRATGLEQETKTKSDGSFSIVDLPIAAYSATFSKDGFKTQVHSEILLQSNRATTVNSVLQPGALPRLME
ncbi:MAG: hypothetical protein DMG38_23755 [Acidobacteria bacterium]|nr:MAG: hypothetical protein DMG38_23755 [Acidobacteriota bacterium]